jgi:hypothetical protein
MDTFLDTAHLAHGKMEVVLDDFLGGVGRQMPAGKLNAKIHPNNCLGDPSKALWAAISMNLQHVLLQLIESDLANRSVALDLHSHI